MAHAHWQKSRGRKPSLPFHGEQNPQKAVRLAASEKTRDLLLNFDAFQVAETAVGESYKVSPLAAHLGLVLHSTAVQVKRDVLRSLNDTHYGMAWSKYLAIAQEEGFEVVGKVPFLSDAKYSPQREETFFILFHPHNGVLLCFDTYGEGVNGGKFYYNWLSDDTDNYLNVISSGSFQKVGDQRIWSGDHDCREALRAHLRGLRDHGKFVTPWKVQPFMWLLNYMDTKDEGYDYRAINNDRVSQLPEYVRTAIQPE